MFFRVTRAGRHQYVQIARSFRDGSAVKQQTLLSLGRLDVLRASGQLDALLRSGLRLSRRLVVLDAQAAKVLAERERVRPELQRLPGLTVYASAANFFLVRVAGPKGAGTRVFESMKAQGVLVKDFSGGYPQMENCLRLTVGTPEENRILLSALRESL